MFDLMRQVDHYCERTDFGILSEPFNFFSNGFFLLAAYAAYRHFRIHPPASPFVQRGLIALLVMVGLGSGCFHSFATAWAEICDVGFIGLFVLWFLWFWLKNILGYSLQKTLLVFLIFFAFTGLCQWIFRDLPVNGSQGYFGIVLFLVALGWHQYRSLSGSLTLLQASFLFIDSLVLRTLDMNLCAVFPLGTHVFWHSLNAAVCYLTIRAMQQEEARLQASS